MIIFAFSKHNMNTCVYTHFPTDRSTMKIQNCDSSLEFVLMFANLIKGPKPNPIVNN